MSFAISFLVGSIAFALTLIIKMPVKALTKRLSMDCYESDVRRKRYNIFIQFLVFVIATFVYWGMSQFIYIDHFKLCSCIRAWVIAIAMYSVYERIIC